MHILVTAGPTREFFDDVRFISNASSGKMGYAIAAEAVRRGHRVVLVSGPVDLTPPTRLEFIPVVGGREMLTACRQHFVACDAAVMCAAVCDYRPASRIEGKAPKATEARSVLLEPTEDICSLLGQAKGERILLGFALETREPHPRAEAKLARKHCDAIVLNRPEGIGRDETTIEVFMRGEGWSAPQLGAKTELAAYLVDLIERLVTSRKPE